MTPLDTTATESLSAIANADPSAFVVEDSDHEFSLCLLIRNLSCPGCIQKIERRLNALPGGLTARVSLSTKRLNVRWSDPKVSAAYIADELSRLGFSAVPIQSGALSQDKSAQDRALLRAMAVAGFAWANIMLLSVSVWAGAVSDMDAATRDFFHWISALIALPAVAYAGQPFFSSAARALSHGHLNMDVPISLAVLLATAVSVWQASVSGPHAYFDAAVMLLFFLLVGRFLDQRSRSRTVTTAQNLLALQTTTGLVVEADGSTRAVPADQLQAGMVVRVLPGDRIPADGSVVNGTSDLDISLVTGESNPVTAKTGTEVFAGTATLSGSLDIRVHKADTDTFLASIVRLMEDAEQAKSKSVRFADRMTRYYAPAVHAAALVTFLGWWLLGSDPWDQALMKAIAVLIITCPCALGLAVPAVQVIAAGRLFKQGILLKSGDALERLDAIDTIVFDKTGTVTEGTPVLTNLTTVSESRLQLAASLAVSSRHPLSKAVVRAARQDVELFSNVIEHPGLGLSAQTPEGEVRLGNRQWCGIDEAPLPLTDSEGSSELWLRTPCRETTLFTFQDRLREDAQAVLTWAKDQNLHTVLLSGDRTGAVRPVADTVGFDEWKAEQSPHDKIAFITDLKSRGHHVLMVGDGLNDAPALAAADVSMSPSTAADVSQTAADLVFLGGSLSAIPNAVVIARKATRRVKENFTLALFYNVVALPIAVAGLFTPLIAALAMSSSSILVTLNAMRFGAQGKKT